MNNTTLIKEAYDEISIAEYEFNRGKQAIKEYKSDSILSLIAIQQLLNKLITKKNLLINSKPSVFQIIRIYLLDKRIEDTKARIAAIKIGIDHIEKLESSNKEPMVHFYTEEDLDADPDYGI